VRLVTPGTLTEDALLDARTHNYLAAWADVRGEGALAWTDISTGDLNVMPCARGSPWSGTLRLSVREVLVQADMDVARQDASGEPAPSVTPLGRAVSTRLRRKSGSRAVRVASLDAFGSSRARRFRRWARCPITSRSRRRAPAAPSAATASQLAARLMQIDVATRRNLELTRSLTGTGRGAFWTCSTVR
jgi:DNA mismatch repair protein MutS